MRTITTNWNNSAYNSAKTFLDRQSGMSITVPAGSPVNHRSLEDSVGAGNYCYAPDAVVALPATVSSVANDTDVITVTATLSAANVEGAPITATTSDATKATVSPKLVNIGPDGNALFTITSVAAGSATITFRCGSVTDTVAVTVS